MLRKTMLDDLPAIAARIPHRLSETKQDMRGKEQRTGFAVGSRKQAAALHHKP